MTEPTTTGSPETTAAVVSTNEVLGELHAYIGQFYPSETLVEAAGFLISSAGSVIVSAVRTGEAQPGFDLRANLLDALIGIVAVAKSAGIDLAEVIDTNARGALGKGVQISFVE